MSDNEKEITVMYDGEEYVLTEKRIRELTSRFIEKCGTQAEMYDDFGMNSKMVEMLTNLKKVWFPETQKHLNLNVSQFDNQLKKFMQKRKEQKVQLEDGGELEVSKNESND